MKTWRKRKALLIDANFRPIALIPHEAISLTRYHTYTYQKYITNPFCKEKHILTCKHKGNDTITEIYLKYFLISFGEINIILMVTEYAVFTSTRQIGKNVYKLWTRAREKGIKRRRWGLVESVINMEPQFT